MTGYNSSFASRTAPHGRQASSSSCLSSVRLALFLCQHHFPTDRNAPPILASATSGGKSRRCASRPARVLKQRTLLPINNLVQAALEAEA
jgi:hypothetical protein